jgi:Fic family protein
MKKAMDYAYQFFSDAKDEAKDKAPDDAKDDRAKGEMKDEAKSYFVGIVTVQFILELHRLIMEGDECAGITRNQSRHVNMSLSTHTSQNTKHIYPSGKIALAGLTAIVDIISTLLLQRPDGTIADVPSLPSIEEVIKLSAWVHFMILDLHPFKDGNGRVARIVGNYLLMGLSPFPILLFQAESTEAIVTERENYIKALEQARSDSRGAPIQLSMMICRNIFQAFINCALPSDHFTQLKKKLEDEVDKFIQNQIN